jgi:hypothetical protein
MGTSRLVASFGLYCLFDLLRFFDLRSLFDPCGFFDLDRFFALECKNDREIVSYQLPKVYRVCHE